MNYTSANTGANNMRAANAGLFGVRLSEIILAQVFDAWETVSKSLNWSVGR